MAKMLTSFASREKQQVLTCSFSGGNASENRKVAIWNAGNNIYLSIINFHNQNNEF